MSQNIFYFVNYNIKTDEHHKIIKDESINLIQIKPPINMKRILPFLILLSFVFGNYYSQNSIPNGNFENWTISNGETPTGFNGSNPEAFFRCSSPLNVSKSTDAYHGTYAMQLNTYQGSSGDTCFGYAITASSTNNPNPCNWGGGTPVNQIATGIRGYYKSNLTNNDSAGIFVAFRNNGTCVGLYLFKLGGINTNYTPFNFSFNPPIAMMPDTMIFGAVSSDAFSNYAVPGSMLLIDSVSLIGITQPAGLNGDFENWAPNTFKKPDNWYIESGGGPQGLSGVDQTTDKAAGNYAVELITHLGDNNGVPRARGGQISTGYYQNNCQGSNCQKGGYPFSNQVDTLCFYYKYAPQLNDSANVMVNFRLNGNTINGIFYSIYNAASTYQYVEIPFNTMGPVDTAIVTLNSSTWYDSALVYIGSNFKVDEMHFKSQALTTGIGLNNFSNEKQLYPNPSNSGEINVSGVEYYDKVSVYNVFGQEVQAKIQKQNQTAKIQLTESGVYYIHINSRGKINILKAVVSH